MKISKYALFISYLVLVGGSAIILIAVTSFRYAETNRLEKFDALTAIDQRLKGAFSAINDFPGSAGKDILFLLNLSSVQSLHRSSNRMISPEVYGDFKNFLKNNGAYKDLLFYRKNFNCLMRVSSESERNNGSCETPPPFFKNILAKAAFLSAGEVYISPLVSYEDIFNENKNASVMVYITPISYDCNIISVIDADYFLEETRRLKREGETVYILDRDGSYLVNPNVKKEKLAGGSDNFYRDFPIVPAGILDDVETRRFNAGETIFTFLRIYPTVSNFALYEGASSVYGKERAGDHYWVMAAVSENFRPARWWRNISYVSSTAVIVISHLFLIILLYCVIFPARFNPALKIRDGNGKV